MNRFRGFTLTELMITVAIASILATVAVPAYQEQVRKAYRAEGESLLLRIAQQQERFLTENSRYTSIMPDLGYESAWAFSDEMRYFALVWPAENCPLTDCYRLLAVPWTRAQRKDGLLVLWSDGRQQRRNGGSLKEGWD